MERSVEARLLLLEKHVAFNGSVGEKVDRLIALSKPPRIVDQRS
jgi:hypothetical protein